jgi:hypothetical protein
MEKLRETMAKFNLSNEMYKTITGFFPDLILWLKQIKDPRRQSHAKYDLCLIALIRILGTLAGGESVGDNGAALNMNKFLTTYVFS